MAYILGLSDTTRVPMLWFKVKETAPNNGDVLTWVAGNNQWEAVAPSGLPAGTDRHVLTYDSGAAAWQSEYPGVVNEPETRTFVILDSTAVAADINTALTNYDTVYLKPGNYALGSTALSLPLGKQLIGLGTSIPVGGENAVYLQFSGSPGSRHILMRSAQLRNVTIQLTGVAHTTHVVEGDATNGTNTVENVKVYFDTGVTTIYGFYGYFDSIVQWSVFNGNGLYIIGASNRPVRISHFYVSLFPAGIGIRVGALNKLYFSDGYITGGARGVYASEALAASLKDIVFSNIVVNVPTVAGFDINGTAAFDIAAHYVNCRVYGVAASTGRGFYAIYADNSTWTNCYADYCNGTSAQAYGAFCIENADNIGVRDCYGAYSTSAGNCDFWFNVVNYSTFTGLRSRGSYTGAHWYNGTCTGNAVSGVEVRDQTNAAGFPLCYNGTYASISSVTAYTPTGRILFTGSQLAVSAIQSYNSTNIGASLNATYSSYGSISTYSAGSYGITTNAPYSTFTGLTACGGASVGIYIEAAAAYSTFTGLVANSNTSYGVQLVNTANRIQISGVESYNNGSWGFYAGELYVSTIGNVNTHQNTANGGFFIGTNNFVTICNVNSYGNTGTGYSRGTSPTTANSSTSAIITSKTNTVAQYSTSGNWNTNGEY